MRILFLTICCFGALDYLKRNFHWFHIIQETIFVVLYNYVLQSRNNAPKFPSYEKSLKKYIRRFFSSTDRSIQWSHGSQIHVFSREAIDAATFFHRSSATHGKVFPQLYRRLGHAPMIVHVCEPRQRPPSRRRERSSNLRPFSLSMNLPFGTKREVWKLYTRTITIFRRTNICLKFARIRRLRDLEIRLTLNCYCEIFRRLDSISIIFVVLFLTNDTDNECH